MPQHFNAPPGWPVPAQWDPPQDWEPDPAWPSAPPGWRFWVDDQPPRPEDLTGFGGDRFGRYTAPDLGVECQQQATSGVSSRSTVSVITTAAVIAAVLASVSSWLIVTHLHHDRGTASAADSGESADPTSPWVTISTQSSAPVALGRPPGDLGLATPISTPACDGQGIVVLGSLVKPSRYAVGVQELLDAHPGAAYLRTDQSCRSLTQRTEQGNAIYAVYTLAGHTQEQLCAAVQAAGGNSYGKWLDNTTDPHYIVPC